jgi:hypothetical protein
MISLKTESRFFEAIWGKTKFCEVRYAGDRDFSAGGKINLLEIDGKGEYTGREILILVSHILTHEDCPQGLQPNYVCLSFQALDFVGKARSSKKKFIA